jgi:AraC-like DNA-binding protein
LLFTGFYFKTGQEKLEIAVATSGYYYVVEAIGEQVLAIQGIVYSILALIMLNNYRSRVIDFQSNINVKIIKGIHAGVVLSLVAWVIGTLGALLDRLDVQIGVDLFLIVYLFFVAIIYIISIYAIRSPEIFKLNEGDVAMLFSLRVKETTDDLIDSGDDEAMPVKSRRIGQKEVDFENELNEALMKYMAESKPFLDPDLSLQKLSDGLDVSRHQLSSSINTYYKMNFYEFINSYRVEEAKGLMRDPTHKARKNYDIAFLSGFNSRATFYRIFKQFTGQTPAEYRGSI